MYEGPGTGCLKWERAVACWRVVAKLFCCFFCNSPSNFSSIYMAWYHTLYIFPHGSIALAVFCRVTATLREKKSSCPHCLQSCLHLSVFHPWSGGFINCFHLDSSFTNFPSLALTLKYGEHTIPSAWEHSDGIQILMVCREIEICSYSVRNYLWRFDCGTEVWRHYCSQLQYAGWRIVSGRTRVGVVPIFSLCILIYCG